MRTLICTSRKIKCLRFFSLLARSCTLHIRDCPFDQLVSLSVVSEKRNDDRSCVDENVTNEQGQQHSNCTALVEPRKLAALPRRRTVCRLYSRNTALCHSIDTHGSLLCFASCQKKWQMWILTPIEWKKAWKSSRARLGAYS